MADEGRLPDSGVTVVPILTAKDSDAPRADPNGATDQTVTAEPVAPPPQNDVVQKRLSDTESALKERQAEFHKLNQQLAELRGEIKATREMTAAREKEPAEPESDWLDSEDIDALASTDTPKALKQVARGLRGDVGKILELRDKEMRDAILRDIRRELSVAVDPRRSEYRPELDELSSKHTWFKDLSPEHQIEIAGVLREKTGGKLRPPSTPGNGSVPAQTQTDDAKQAAIKELAIRTFSLNRMNAKPGMVQVTTTPRGS
jgi:hypothetical protein